MLSITIVELNCETKLVLQAITLTIMARSTLKLFLKKKHLWKVKKNRRSLWIDFCRIGFFFLKNDIFHINTYQHFMHRQCLILSFFPLQFLHTHTQRVHKTHALIISNTYLGQTHSLTLLPDPLVLLIFCLHLSLSRANPHARKHSTHAQSHALVHTQHDPIPGTAVKMDWTSFSGFRSKPTEKW